MFNITLTGCVVFCSLSCTALSCVVICLLFVSLVCWLKLSQSSCTFIARLDATTRQKDNSSEGGGGGMDTAGCS